MLGRLLLTLINSWHLLQNGLRRVLRRRVDYIYLELSGALPEFAEPPPLVQRMLGARQPPTLTGLRTKLQRITNDPQTRGVVLVLRDFAGGWSTAESLRDELYAFRKQGRRVIAYLPGADTRTYFAACAADEIIMPPSATLNLLGLAAELLFLRDALKMVGIEAEVTAVSPYKAAGEPLVRSEISPENREQLDRLLDWRFERLIFAIAADRSLTPEQVRELIDAAPYTAEAARAAGLITATCYEDELESRLTKQMEKDAPQPAKKPFKAVLLQWDDARSALRIPYRQYQRQTVAVVSVEGAIINGKSRDLPVPLPLIGGQQAGSESVAQALRKVEQNERIAALVLHVDSRGGDAFASDLIWREVLRVRQKKPVVVSMGNVAASGGYYVAACANTIVAQASTLTGSIGVLVLRPIAAGLLERMGVNTTVLSRGAHADFLDTTRQPTDEDRELLRRLVFESYDEFKQRVREGRDLSDEQLEPLAGGRVWTGQEAQEHGLVDELGGLPTAIARARALAKLPADPTLPVRWVTPDKRDNLMPKPFAANPAGWHLSPDLLHELLRPRVLAALPWELRER